jgi:DNA-binding transcriptional MocR family regulator
VSGNLATLRQMLKEDEHGLVNVLHAEGGWNVLLRFPAVIDEDELVIALMRDCGLTAQPGYFFDMDSNGFLALSLLPEPPEFERNVGDVLQEVNSRIASMS